MTKAIPTENTTRLLPQQPRNSPDVAQAVCGVGSGDASNCIDKNFDCNYGLQVTFLAKNSITVRADELEQSGDAASTKKGSYSKIQFVNEDPLSIDNLVTPQVSSPESNVETASTPLPLPFSASPRGLLPGKENGKGSVHYSVSDRETLFTEPYIEERETSNTYRGARSHSQHHETLAPWEHDGHAHAHLDRAPTPPVTLESTIPPSTFSAKDEYAVQGLLALGTQPGSCPAPESGSGSGSGNSGAIPGPIIARADNHGNGEIGPVVDAEGTPDRMISVMSAGFVDGILQPTIGHDVSPPAPSILDFDIGGSNVNSYSFPRQMSDYKTMPQTWKLQLLQNYRYHVAPWLDILDLSHSFGITVLQIAFDSSTERLLHAILALSDTSMRVRQDRGYSDAAIQLDPHFYSHSFQAVHYEDTTASYSDSLVNAAVDETEAMLLRLFEKLGKLVADVARAWAMDRDQYEQDGRSNCYEYRQLRSLVDRAYGLGMDSAIYWMVLRMDLGMSLANNTPLRILLPPHSLPSLSRLVRIENTHERVSHYAQALLSLCGKALNIYHQQDAAPAHQAANPDNWFQVFEKLSQWYYLRPQEFHPMVELNHDGVDALSAGKCKPRTATALLNQHQKLNPHSPVLSPLWHAHRGRVLGSLSAGILSCRG
ncbi:hypothetical protein AN2956.2 [Aspergillus nidulans FGSC A4]|uniref:Transcription factor domain-containing protein n=1 Tax=Emericella nidulans (strain FGSC A4 / ATCC 38163 / CBS 112.46 / NRRL 194 / M139) TaxID=227321 RepID=Q5B924_EMENI|nr:hypothetical protein [Aspergillus nidulans FGSC A4]EAA63527.1 hypothetical protein AN2956.2 [Aspergillus nidulans FGSC A4]CBF83676.1 TPA: conserved hypothetical protein [Aspergillus nidulans FGSC A4]|eukprot:XP_660560.1 hypothetical protein AN2956.2 [Aspergillus nidulans FGSC A4]